MIMTMSKIATLAALVAAVTLAVPSAAQDAGNSSSDGDSSRGDSSNWGGGWSGGVVENPNGGYNAYITNDLYVGVAEPVGRYQTKREARRAARQAAKDKTAQTGNNVWHTGEECDNPLFNC